MAKSLSMIEDEWQRIATQDAIAAARRVITEGGGVNPRAMVGSLSDTEWGWIVCAAIFGWIATRGKQATAEGLGIYEADQKIRALSGQAPEPWEAGAVDAVLPALSEINGIDWSKPVGEWAKDQVVAFAWRSYKLIDGALAAQDEGKLGLTHRTPTEQERLVSAANGGPLMTREELLDNPFV
jgi:hypothetical protein